MVEKKGLGFFNRFLITFVVLVVLVVALAVLYKPIQLAPGGASGSGGQCKGDLVGSYVQASDGVNTTYTFNREDSSGSDCSGGYCLTKTVKGSGSYSGCVPTSCEVSTTGKTGKGSFALLYYGSVGLDKRYFASVPDYPVCETSENITFYRHMACSGQYTTEEPHICNQGCEQVILPDPLTNVNVTVAHCINDNFTIST